MERRGPNRMLIQGYSRNIKPRIILYVVNQFKRRCILDALYTKEESNEPNGKNRSEYYKN